MSAGRLLLSDKYKAFLRCDAPVEFLEGTTAAGKTTVGLFKFMLKVAESPKSCTSWLRMTPAPPRRTSSRRTWASWMTSACWWSTKATAAVDITCLTSYSTHPAAIR